MFSHRIRAGPARSALPVAKRRHRRESAVVRTQIVPRGRPAGALQQQRAAWRKSRACALAAARSSRGADSRTSPREVRPCRSVGAAIASIPRQRLNAERDVVMPYASEADLPMSVRRHLPPHAQHIFRQAFNHAWKQYGGDESRAFRVAWCSLASRFGLTTNVCSHTHGESP